MKVAVVGLGVIGAVHAEILRKRGDLYAVCDVDESKLSAYDAVKETDYIRLLDEVKPEAVHICTPHYLHADMVIEALKRNIHVLCEKPLCICEEDIVRILEAERASSATLGVCLQNRYNASNVYAKEYLADKKILAGDALVAWRRTAGYYASAPWRGKWATEGGGVLINQSLHTLDLLQWLCGMPKALTASVSNLTLQKEIEVEDTATLLMEGDSPLNFFATIGSGRDLPVELTVWAETAEGKRETIKVMPNYVVIDEKIVSFEALAPSKYGKVCYGSGHEPLIAHFYDCIAEGKPFPINGEEGAKVVRLILAAYRSKNNKTEISK